MPGVFPSYSSFSYTTVNPSSSKQACTDSWFFSMYFYFKASRRPACNNPSCRIQTSLSHDWWDVVSLVWRVCHFKDVKIFALFVATSEHKTYHLSGKTQSWFSVPPPDNCLPGLLPSTPFPQNSFCAVSTSLTFFLKQWNAVLDGTDNHGVFTCRSSGFFASVGFVQLPQCPPPVWLQSDFNAMPVA